jgi:carbamoyltransferase
MTSMASRTYTLGLCSTYHDPAIAILDPDGAILFAEALERPLQYKRAINCEADNPFVLSKLLNTYCNDAEAFVIAYNWDQKRPFYEHLSKWLGWLTPEGIRTYRGRQLTACLETWELNYMQACQHHANRRTGINLGRILRTQFEHAHISYRHYRHHTTHAALGVYGSGFETAACAVIDSYGEMGSMAFFGFEGGKLRLLFESKGPGSLGFFYMKLTELCGFDWMGGEEWKVMGLAPYGKPDPTILALLRSMFSVEGLKLRMNRKTFFTHLKALEPYRRFVGDPAESVADLAHTGQLFFMEILNQLLTNLHDHFPSTQLVLSGGCALNSVANGQIKGQTPFKNIYIPSAPADDGTALGAALLAYEEHHPRRHRPVMNPYTGSELSLESAERFAQNSQCPVSYHEGPELNKVLADLLSKGFICGFVQGRAEFGPRALGHRSILADPRSCSVKDRINETVKFRERFRPYAPSILHEYGPEYFVDYQDSPYMDKTFKFWPEAISKVPGVAHTDGTGRVQSVTLDRNPEFHGLLTAFHELTGCPILLNTSFNVMGKPMIHSIEDAFGVFMGSGLDALVVGSYLFRKPEHIV